MCVDSPMSTRALRHRTVARSGSMQPGEARADAHPAAASALPKAAVARLARLDAADMPWLGQGGDAALAGYDGPEISGPSEYPAGPTKGR